MSYLIIFAIGSIIGHMVGWADRGRLEAKRKRIADATTDYKNNPPIDDL